MKRSEAEQVYKLIKEETRAEIYARHAEDIVAKDWGDAFQIKLEKLDEIRELIFGTSDLVELGYRWGILKKRKPIKTPKPEIWKPKKKKKKKGKKKTDTYRGFAE